MTETQTATGNGELTEFARAKINLALHVTGKREDGYHLLDSLAVFPDIGDRLTAHSAEGFSFALTGPFASSLADEDTDSNLVVKAVRFFCEEARLPLPEVALTLEKALPVASGIGGGSADAAACLRLMARMTGKTLSPETLATIALRLGADVPVCLNQTSARMSGIGETVAPGPTLPKCGMVLVNPGVPVSTPAVFKMLKAETDGPVSNSPLPAIPASFSGLSDLTNWLEGTRNDLSAPAEHVCANITTVLQALRHDPATAFARMSGSGATCYALTRQGEEEALATRLKALYPTWWTASGQL